MAYYSSTNIPEFAGVYVTIAADQLGTVAANNIIAMYNPANSAVAHVALLLAVGAYSIGASGTSVSFVGKRITAVSGGTKFTNANIDRFDTTMPDPTSSVYIGNPTVTLDRFNTNFVIEPPLSNGAGNALVKSLSTVPGASFVLYPGQGLVFGTASGNTNQVWNIEYVWGEVAL